jgi:hypothetical protein
MENNFSKILLVEKISAEFSVEKMYEKSASAHKIKHLI